MIIRNFITKPVLLILVLTGFAFAGSSIPGYYVEPLPQYNKFFHNEKGWIGADGAYSVALSDNTTLWLYGDTFIGDIVNGVRKNPTIINNSIAIQRGKYLSTASVEFFWNTSNDGKPVAFIAPVDGRGWFWPFDGILINGKLYLFLMQIDKTGKNSVFGFKITGTWLAEVENPCENPVKWKITQHKIPWGAFSTKRNLFFGSALMKDKEFVYIYGCSENRHKGKEERSMVAARVPYNKITDFKEWRFFSNAKWKTDMNQISKLFNGIATEYSVCYHPAVKRYIAVYTGSKDIMMRFSPTPVGPWSSSLKLYECPEYNWHKNYFCYAAKAHPEISPATDELIVTYVCNSADFFQLEGDSRIYWPRFLGVKFYPRSDKFK